MRTLKPQAPPREETIYQIEHEAVMILMQQLGPLRALRFLHSLGWGRGDYTAERRSRPEPAFAELCEQAVKRNKLMLPKARSEGKVIYGEPVPPARPTKRQPRKKAA